MSYRDFMTQNIFQKLEMNHTIINDSKDANIEEKAIGINFLKSKEVQSFITGPGGIYTTIEDLYKWHLTLCNPQIVHKVS